MSQKMQKAQNLRGETEYWHNLVQDILTEARAKGTTAAEVSVSHHVGFSVNVRMGAVETLEHNRDKSIDITVYDGARKGSASTNDVTPEAITSTIDYAYEIAKLSSEDSYSGLADANLMAKEVGDFDLYHPWNISPDHAIELALECESYARDMDKRIAMSEGVGVGNREGITTYGNSHGFIGSIVSTKHDVGAVLVAQDANGMQRDGYHTQARDAADLESLLHVAKEAVFRTVNRLGARRIKTCSVPVIFHADVAKSLIANFLGAISGGNLFRKSSFLVDHLGKQVFSKHINIYERPFLPKGWASCSFDAEGVATHERELVKDGILQGYLLGSYSARKLGMTTTGNAGGAHNIMISTSDMDLSSLIKHMGKGLLVTELMGQGVNLVTGDYSRGVAGYWIEDGAIQFPVEEITIAGNLGDMYANLVAMGNDIDSRSGIYCGSMLIDSMTVAGD